MQLLSSFIYRTAEEKIALEGAVPEGSRKLAAYCFSECLCRTYPAGCLIGKASFKGGWV
jgi:hypothetical protein